MLVLHGGGLGAWRHGGGLGGVYHDSVDAVTVLVSETTPNGCWPVAPLLAGGAGAGAGVCPGAGAGQS